MVAVIFKARPWGQRFRLPHRSRLRQGEDKIQNLVACLYTSIVLPLSIREAIVSRIKILTDMKIDEEEETTRTAGLKPG